MHHMQFNKEKTDHIPVVVSPNRYEGIELIKNTIKEKVDCIVMDDGMQHLALRANHYFLLIPKDLSNEAMLPAGTLREPLYEAEKRANTIVKVNKGKSFHYENTKKTLLSFDIKSDKLIDLANNNLITKEKISEKIKAVDTICAIANPDNFKNSIQNLGISINKSHNFRDHYKFNKKDISKLNFPVITTRKDAEKIAELIKEPNNCLLYTSPSPRDQRGSRMPSSA